MTDEAGLLREALEAIRDYEPVEVMKDEFAYDRMVESYRNAARAALAVAQVPAPAKCDELWECGGGKHEPGCAAYVDLNALPAQEERLEGPPSGAEGDEMPTFDDDAFHDDHPFAEYGEGSGRRQVQEDTACPDCERTHPWRDHAAPPAPEERLDVERLARAMVRAWPQNRLGGQAWGRPSIEMAAAIAAEYERISREAKG